LKADVNVQDGDIITFSTGELKQDQWVFKVHVNRTGEEKLFRLNTKNFNAISGVYRPNSDDWNGKNSK
jgi:hypothetical protein